MPDTLDQIIAHLEDGELDAGLRLLDRWLAVEGSEPQLHAFRALILLAMERPTEATISVKRALALDANDGYVQRTAAEVWLALQEPAAAIAAARSALTIDTNDHEAIVLEARARALLGQWDEVIKRMDYVLMFEPTNERAAVVRAVALTSKEGNRGTLAHEEWETLVASFPLNSFARAGHGWKLLELGRRPAAEEEFRQALTLDPGATWAKEGLVTALKARYPGYGLLLRFFFWMNSVSPRARLLVAIGGLVGYNFLRRVARANPEIEPFVTPVLIAYALYILMSWLADPLLNLVLMVHSEGRRVLSDDDRKSGLLVGACLATAIVLALLRAWTPWDAASYGAVIIGAAAFTFAGAFKCAPGKYRSRLLTLAAIFVTAGLASTIVSEDLAQRLVVFGLLGVIITTWLARSWLEKSYVRGAERAPGS